MNPELAWMVGVIRTGWKARFVVRPAASPSNTSRPRWRWLRSQFRDEPQNLLGHLPWDGDLGHLEGDIAAVAHDLLDILESVQRTRIARSFPALQCRIWVKRVVLSAEPP